jgi:hypothetical protein
MPPSLCTAFVREQQVPVLEGEYPDDGKLGGNWRQTGRLRRLLFQTATAAT